MSPRGIRNQDGSGSVCKGTESEVVAQSVQTYLVMQENLGDGN